jgi:hypothetical protein
LPELRRTEIAEGTPEIGVIEDIEEIPSRLKSKSLVDLELLPQRQIDLGTVLARTLAKDRKPYSAV